MANTRHDTKIFLRSPERERKKWGENSRSRCRCTDYRHRRFGAVWTGGALSGSSAFVAKQRRSMKGSTPYRSFQKRRGSFAKKWATAGRRQLLLLPKTHAQRRLRTKKSSAAFGPATAKNQRRAVAPAARADPARGDGAAKYCGWPYVYPVRRDDPKTKKNMKFRPGARSPW